MGRKKTDSVPVKFEPGFIAGLDNRTGIAQAMRERYHAFTSDLGGDDRLSYAQRSLCERALWLEHWLREQERTLASGGEFNIGAWVQAANSLQGILSKLGLERQSKEIPDLSEFLRKRAGQ